ncbi:MAG: ATP-binding cassette domain-containing protein [Aliidongia sp.]
MTPGVDLAPADLETRRLSMIFRGRRDVAALNDVSFALKPGRALALVGESGSGKSTCAKLLTRMLTASGGQILFKGRDVTAASSRRELLHYRSQVQMVVPGPLRRPQPGPLDPAPPGPAAGPAQTQAQSRRAARPHPGTAASGRPGAGRDAAQIPPRAERRTAPAGQPGASIGGRSGRDHRRRGRPRCWMSRSASASWIPWRR